MPERYGRALSPQPLLHFPSGSRFPRPAVEAGVYESYYKARYINVVEEPGGAALGGETLRLLREYEKAGGAGGGDEWGGERYESVKRGTKTFHRFLKRIERLPGQCIRYSYRGLALHAVERSGPPACESCGASRVYEMQLLPPVMRALQPLDKAPRDLYVVAMRIRGAMERGLHTRPTILAQGTSRLGHGGRVHVRARVRGCAGGSAARGRIGRA